MRYGQILDPEIHFEILSTVKSNLKSSFLWQPNNDSEEKIGKKKIMMIKSLTLSPFNKTLDVFPKNDEMVFDSTKPIYFYSKHRNLIFKGQISFNSKFKISVHWPLEILVKEEREDFRDASKSVVDIDLKSRHFTMPVLDKSASGLSIRVPRSEALHFEELDLIKIKINKREVMGVVKYVKQFNNPVYKNHYRIGIST